MVNGRSKRGVLIVDDSAFVRAVVSDVVNTMSDVYVVGQAASGDEAIEMVEALRPDVLTLDIEMPGRDGLSALEWVMREHPTPVVMLSGRDDGEGAALTIRALELGAVDFVRKPSWGSALDVATLQSRLPQALRMALRGRVPAPRASQNVHAPSVMKTKLNNSGAAWTPTRARSAAPMSSLLVIAASTGGPRALTDLFVNFPLLKNTAVIIVQHMPAPFTASLAVRLDQLCHTMPVAEIRGTTLLRGGHVHVAPGGQTLTLVNDADGALCAVPVEPSREHRIHPAADPVLIAAAQLMGSCVMAVILTGMGRDGAHGAQLVKAAGGRVVVQDPQDCVVSGMVTAVLDAVPVDAVADIAQLPRTIAALLHEG